MNDERLGVFVMCVPGVVTDRSCDLDSTLNVLHMYRVSGKCPALSDALDPRD
jgi:hypothetical protein